MWPKHISIKNINGLKGWDLGEIKQNRMNFPIKSVKKNKNKTQNIKIYANWVKQQI